MSTILKALRRLEQEKARTDRPLREQVTGPGGADRGDGRPPRRWPILLGGVGAGVVAGLALLWLVVSRGDSAREAAPEAAAPPAATAAAAPPQAEPRATRRSGPIGPAQPPAARSVQAPAARAALPEPEVPEEVAVIDRGSPGPRIIAEPPAPGAEPSAPKPGSVRPLHREDPRVLPGRHVLPEDREDPEAPVAVPEAASAKPPAPAIPPRPAEPARTPAPAPRAAEPARSPAEQPPAEAPRAAAKAPPDRTVEPVPSAPFPAIRVERTSWHPVAERRVALIDVPHQGAQSVHEGELVAGVLVKRIEPSAVVFEHAGRVVRRKIGVP